MKSFDIKYRGMSTEMGGHDDKSYTCGAQVLYFSTTSPILVKTPSESAFRQNAFQLIAFFKKSLKKINKC